MIYTTLNKIREHGPCSDGWTKLLRYLNKTQADDEPLAIATILDSNGLDDALWCLRAVEEHDREIRLYAVWCARQVQHSMTDPRSVAALAVAERHANGQATVEELYAAWVAAGASARVAAGASARAHRIAAAGAAAGATASAVVSAAARGAARAATRAAAGDEELAATRAAQAAEFRRVFCSEEVIL